jgi:sugar/nucleoside kinase (ribokinase family)
MPPSPPAPTLGVIGPVRVAYGITSDGVVHLAQPGGSALYAAGGAKVWADKVTVLSRATDATRSALLPALAANGIDPAHIRLIPGSETELEFHAVRPSGDAEETNPSSQFLRVGRPLPKELLGFRMPDRTAPLDAPPGQLAARAEDLPPRTQHWQAVHLTAMEYFAQATLPARLQELGIRRITLDPAAGLMDPARRMELATVLRSLHAFLPSEEEILALHRPHQPDLWECAEELSGLGPWIVVIKRGALGAWVWDANSRMRWNVPAYGASERDRFGAGDAFCGGFVAGLALTDDPLEAALRGAVSASLAIEGFGALYPLGATPGLAGARLDALREQARRV